MNADNPRDRRRDINLDRRDLPRLDRRERLPVKIPDRPLVEREPPRDLAKCQRLDIAKLDDPPVTRNPGGGRKARTTLITTTHIPADFPMTGEPLPQTRTGRRLTTRADAGPALPLGAYPPKGREEGERGRDGSAVAKAVRKS